MTVNDVLQLPIFNNAVVVAGKKGLKNNVENMSVMEVPDIEDYISKGDFLLTTLFPVYKEESMLKSLIIKLSESGLSGIGIKLNRYIDNIPECFIEQSNELGFPIVILPASSNLSELINIFLKDTLERKNVELKYRNNIHNQLLEIILKGQEHSSVADKLSSSLKKSVTLLNSDFEVLAEKRSPYDQKFDVANLNCPAITCKENCYLPVNWDKRFGYVYVVHYGAERVGYILISSNSGFDLSPLDKVAVEQFSIVFRIIVQKQRTIVELEHQYVTEFTWDLLYGKIDNESTALRRANAFGWELTFPQSVCLIEVGSSYKVPDKIVLTEKIQDLMYRRYTGTKRWRVFCANTGRFITLFINDVVAKSYKRLFELIENLLETLEIDSYHVAVSRPSNSLEGINHSYIDAQRTIDVAKMVGEKKLLHFKETGVFRVIQSNSNKEELWEFCKDSIGVILEYDKKHNTNLIETLEALLKNGGNVKDTASQLFVHYNTIRYRKKLISQLLGFSLTTPNSYQDLSLAIKIYHTLSLSNSK